MAKTLSTLTPADVREYARVDEDAGSDELLQAMLDSAVSFCLAYTGLDASDAEFIPELALCALMIACDLYDTRSVTVDKNSVNPTISAILGAYARNLV